MEIRIRVRVEYPGQQNQDFRFLCSRLKTGTSLRILDAGCGRGLYLRELIKHGSFVTGVDRSPEALREASDASGRPPLSVGLLQQLPYLDGVFDLVLSIEVLTHVRPVAQMSVIREFFRVLKPGGTLLLTVHNSTRHQAHRLKRRIVGRSRVPAGMPIFPLGVHDLRRALQHAGFLVGRRVKYLNFFNTFGFELAQRRPQVADALAYLEDAMARLPIVRRLGITFFLEGTRPEVAS